MTTWIEDANGNKCSVEYFGSAEDSQKALDSLKGCRNCVNCSDCSDCSGCSYCSYCSDCSGCRNCVNCSYCSFCSDCSYCSGCSDCSGCSYCSYCSALKDTKGGFVPLVVPVIADIHRVIYEAASAPEALHMSDWHSCGTTHCRAGWAVHLAGEEGYALEHFHGTALAAQLIYDASGHPISPVRFFDSNEDALADMKRLAGAV